MLSNQIILPEDIKTWRLLHRQLVIEIFKRKNVFKAMGQVEHQSINHYLQQAECICCIEFNFPLLSLLVEIMTYYRL